MRQNDPRFTELLQRYLRGLCSPEEERAVETWYDSLGGQREPLPLNPEAAEELEHKLWQRIQARAAGGRTLGNRTETDRSAEDRPEEDRSSGRRPGGGWYRNWMIYIPGTAAVLLLLVGMLVNRNRTVFVGARKEAVPAVNLEPAVHEKANHSSTTILVVLEDESMVWLKPSGSIRYTDFSGSLRREVTLSGEAYFEVAKNPDKPFVVRSGNVLTRVTGTKFNVKAYAGENTVEVEVTEGSVEVRREDEPNVKLSARQKAVYHTGSRKPEKLSMVSSRLRPVEKVSRELTFEFSDTPLRKVVDLLEEAYPVSIELENRALEYCPLTASFNNETLEDKLELICASIGATFSSAPGKITIAGKGCAP